MGTLSVSDLLAYLIPLNVVGFAFLSWMLRFSYKTAVSVTSSSDSQSGTAQVLCACVCKRFSALQCNMATTVATVALFCVSVITMVVANTLWLAVCGSHCDKQRPSSVSFVYGVNSFCFFVGYLLMFVTHFERLRLTFSGTSMQLPKWAPNGLYGFLLTLVLLIVVQYAFLYIEPFVSAVCLLLLALLYFGFVTGLIAAFFQKTAAIANNSQHRSLLLEPAIRVTVSVTVSLLSTTIAFIFWVTLLSFCPFCLIWRLVGYTLLTFDMCLSAFCFMCTFRRGKHYYQKVFGRLDSIFLRSVPRMAITTMKEEATSATAAL